MNVRRAMWGSVSHGGELWVLHFPIEGSSSSICREGYGPDTFEGFHSPVIRFDKAPLDAVMKWLHGPAITVKGHELSLSSYTPKMSLEEYLDRTRSFGIPVETWDGRK